ncbi:MAG: hypothetical protein FWD13_09550 [Treponema sp.]|nr:hypothetical protein [Treponema sp.]
MTKIKKIKIPAFLFLLIFIFISCIGQNSNVFTPVPDFSIYESNNSIDINSIIGTKDDGAAAEHLPTWLFAYIEGGIEAVEKLDSYNNKYAFIGINEGINFTALTKWADNISAVYDFPIMAAQRTGNRMILTASQYPDDEYGIFYETMIKNAYNNEYPGAVKEDVYWIKVRFEDENTHEYKEKYMFFVLITINKTPMQVIIRDMISKTIDTVNLSRNQRNTVNRLRQNFFEGF